MLKTGLTSITFRQLTLEKLVSLVSEAGMDGIEWGGDVHVPPGDLDTAAKARDLTGEAGLQVSSYGSYARCDGRDESFGSILQTARVLGAPVLRVWAGETDGVDDLSAYRKKVVDGLREYTRMATDEGITLGVEYHGGTFTETCESAHQLLSEVGMAELKLYWQPRSLGPFEGSLAEAKKVVPYLAHIHAFHWLDNGKGQIDVRPLAEGVSDWHQYLQALAGADQPSWDRYILLEFVKNNDPEQFKADAKVLKEKILA